MNDYLLPCDGDYLLPCDGDYLLPCDGETTPRMYILTCRDISRTESITNQATVHGISVVYHGATYTSSNKVENITRDHVDIYRRFLESGERVALVGEDDIILDKNFCRNLTSVVREIPADENVSVLVLGCICYNKRKAVGRLYKPTAVFAGLQLILISRAYAVRAVEWFEQIHPTTEFGLLDDNRVNPETFLNIATRESGYLAEPMLAVESIMLPSHRDKDRCEKFHVRKFWYSKTFPDFDIWGESNHEWLLLFGDFYKQVRSLYFCHHSAHLLDFLLKYILADDARQVLVDPGVCGTVDPGVCDNDNDADADAVFDIAVARDIRFVKPCKYAFVETRPMNAPVLTHMGSFYMVDFAKASTS